MTDVPHAWKTASLLCDSEDVQRAGAVDGEVQACLIRACAVLHAQPLQGQMGRFEHRLNRE